MALINHTACISGGPKKCWHTTHVNILITPIIAVLLAIALNFSRQTLAVVQAHELISAAFYGIVVNFISLALHRSVRHKSAIIWSSKKTCCWDLAHAAFQPTLTINCCLLISPGQVCHYQINNPVMVRRQNRHPVTQGSQNNNPQHQRWWKSARWCCWGPASAINVQCDHSRCSQPGWSLAV